MESPATATPATTLALLRGARRLLSHPEYWTKQAYGRDADGEVEMRPAKCKCFCLVGALIATLGLETFDDGADEWPAIVTAAVGYLSTLLPPDWVTRNAVLDEYPTGCIAAYQDDPTTTFADVAALLDCGIRRLERGAGGGHHGGQEARAA